MMVHNRSSVVWAGDDSVTVHPHRCTEQALNAVSTSPSLRSFLVFDDKALT